MRLTFRPFGQCYELLTQKTVTQYLLPIIEAVPKFLDSLNDEDLKKEAKNESKNDAVSAIIKSLKSLASCVPSQEENIRQLEMFRLKMILRQLQISSFGGKMNALNEVNRVITSVSYYPQQSGPNTQGQIIGGNNQVRDWNIEKREIVNLRKIFLSFMFTYATFSLFREIDKLLEVMQT